MVFFSRSISSRSNYYTRRRSFLIKIVISYVTFLGAVEQSSNVLAGKGYEADTEDNAPSSNFFARLNVLQGYCRERPVSTLAHTRENCATVEHCSNPRIRDFCLKQGLMHGLSDHFTLLKEANGCRRSSQDLGKYRRDPAGRKWQLDPVDKTLVAKEACIPLRHYCAQQETRMHCWEIDGCEWMGGAEEPDRDQTVYSASGYGDGGWGILLEDIPCEPSQEEREQEHDMCRIRTQGISELDNAAFRRISGVRASSDPGPVGRNTRFPAARRRVGTEAVHNRRHRSATGDSSGLGKKNVFANAGLSMVASPEYRMRMQTGDELVQNVPFNDCNRCKETEAPCENDAECCTGVCAFTDPNFSTLSLVSSTFVACTPLTPCRCQPLPTRFQNQMQALDEEDSGYEAEYDIAAVGGKKDRQKKLRKTGVPRNKRAVSLGL